MVETLDEILRKALEYHGSDVFVVPGSHIMTKANGRMIPISQEKALPNDITVLVGRAYELAHREQDTLINEGDDDFSFAVRDLSRFRCNTYRQRGSLAMTCRVVAFGVPDPETYHIPDVVMHDPGDRTRRQRQEYHAGLPGGPDQRDPQRTHHHH